MTVYKTLRIVSRGPSLPPLILIFDMKDRNTFFLGLEMSLACDASDEIGRCTDNPDSEGPNSTTYGTNGSRCKEQVGLSPIKLVTTPHPYIWNATQIVPGPENRCLAIFPYPSFGCFSSLLHRRRQRREFFSETQICTWFVQVAAAVHYLHSQGCWHGHIDSRHLLLGGKSGDDLILTLYDSDALASGCLPFSGSLGNDGSLPCGKYCEHQQEKEPSSPNKLLRTVPFPSISHRKISTTAAAADIRALGCLLFALCSLEWPDLVQCSGCVAGKQCHINANIEQEGASWQTIVTRYHPEIASVISQLLHSPYDQLPSAKDLALRGEGMRRATDKLLKRHPYLFQSDTRYAFCRRRRFKSLL